MKYFCTMNASFVHDRTYPFDDLILIGVDAYIYIERATFILTFEIVFQYCTDLSNFKS